MAGEVRLGEDARRAEKPGQLVSEDVPLAVAASPRFVSRGGEKLANALGAFELDVADESCLDVGASTGGFTDCLLQAGAAAVAAVDVAYGELHWNVRSDPRVHVIERRNARELRPDELPFRPELIAIDVSFISLTKVLGPVLRCAAERFDCMALVKPQFEAGREAVGKGGVVRSAEERRATLVGVGEFVVRELGASVLGYAPSGLPGPAGNEESFIWIGEPGRAGAVEDVAAAARRAEP